MLHAHATCDSSGGRQPGEPKAGLAPVAEARHTVETAANGKEALEAFERRTFDAVLMDVQMPEMSGFEATAAIRARELETGTHIHIIAMTAHAMSGDRERCLEAGMDDYIAKPIRPAELFAAVERPQHHAAAGMTARRGGLTTKLSRKLILGIQGLPSAWFDMAPLFV